MEEERSPEQQAQTEALMSAHPSKNRENRCLLLFLRSQITGLSYSLFQFPVPPSRKPPSSPLRKWVQGQAWVFPSLLGVSRNIRERSRLTIAQTRVHAS